jgi:hypothetical protein
LKITYGDIESTPPALPYQERVSPWEGLALDEKMKKKIGGWVKKGLIKIRVAYYTYKSSLLRKPENQGLLREREYNIIGTNQIFWHH